MTFKNQFIQHERTAAEEQWLAEERAEQEERFAKIDQQMRDLAPTREGWYAEFFDRISSRGFNFDGDQRVVVKRDDLPAKPADSKDQVIWKYGVESDN